MCFFDAGETNGKSNNLNNCLKNVIYSDYKADLVDGAINWQDIPNTELIVIFDADMVCKPDFFLKTLEVCWCFRARRAMQT